MLQKEREGEDGEMASCTDNPVFLLIAEPILLEFLQVLHVLWQN